jgi:predicted transcriptional regulator
MNDAAVTVRPLHILIPTDLHTRLKEMADERDRSVAAETRRAIEGRLKEFESEKASVA